MENKIMSKTFLWMFVGLFVTFLTGFAISTNEAMILNIYTSSIYILLCIVELVLVIVLSLKAKSMSKNTARAAFILYSFVSGLTFSSIFITYEITSIIYIFLISSVVFLVFGLIGYYTEIDLTKFSTLLLMALFSVLVCYLVNIFLSSETFDFFLTVICLLIFMGFTAYDVQKIKKLSYESDIPEDNLSIIGALELYLDYINIFLDLLHLFGSSRD